MSPCKECIVKAMCKKACPKYSFYVDDSVARCGIYIDPPFAVSDYIRELISCNSTPKYIPLAAKECNRDRYFSVNIYFSKNGNIRIKK